MNTYRNIAALVCGLVLAGTASAQVDCCPTGLITGFVNDDVIAAGCNCRVTASGDINGNLTQTGDGGVVVDGRTNGIEESGAGGVTVRAGGLVKGNITEAGDGNVAITSGGSVEGGIAESGLGTVNITVGGGGAVKTDVVETGAGSVLVTVTSGAFEGGVDEYDTGDVRISTSAGTSFKGDAREQDGGSAIATVAGLFEGNLGEAGSGNLSTAGTGTFKGNSQHELPGTCSNTIVDFQGNVCEL